MRWVARGEARAYSLGVRSLFVRQHHIIRAASERSCTESPDNSTVRIASQM